MPKHEPNSPKAIANRIKSKGLQKLRWYCQMCQKQCRDANGFKCHTTSEAHQRQLLIFGESPNQFLGEFSSDFEKGYMDILRRQYGTRRVAANQVYQEYIKHKDHIHMNATRWVSLTGFCLYLGKSGKAVVDETEKGWFIKYIERDPEELRRQEQLRRRGKVELDDEERAQQHIRDQVEKAASTSATTSTEFTELPERSETDQKVVFSLVPIKKEESADEGLAETSEMPKAPFKFNALQVAARSASVASSRAASVAKSSTSKRPMSAMEEIMLVEEEKRKRRMAQSLQSVKTVSSASWLRPNLVVKVVRLSERDAGYSGKMADYYDKKGVVVELVDEYTAKVRMMDSGAVLKLDQEHVRTVLPGLGRSVVVVNRKLEHCGETGVLMGLDERSYSASVQLTSGPASGQVVARLAYEDICKVEQ